MRGVYIARIDLDLPNHLGVARKIDAQIVALSRALGPVSRCSLRVMSVECDGITVFSRDQGWRSRQRLYGWDFYHYAAAASVGADYVYIRYQRCTPAFLRLLHRLKMDSPWRPVFIEIPTFPYEGEQISLRDRALGWLDRSTRGHMRRYVDRIVTFSAHSEIFGIPTVITENGVDIEAIPAPVRAFEVGATTGPFRIAAVANVSFYHGYDRLLRGLATHRSRADARDVRVKIIGSGTALPSLQQLVNQLGIGEHVTFLGPLSGAALDTALRDVDLAVSSLGRHRANAQTSDLKSREYCARGLPFLLSNPDRDFPDDFPFAIRVPMDDSAIDIGAVVRARVTIGTRFPDYALRMRNHAEAHLTWESKLEPVISQIRAFHGG